MFWHLLLLGVCHGSYTQISNSLTAWRRSNSTLPQANSVFSCGYDSVLQSIFMIGGLETDKNKVLQWDIANDAFIVHNDLTLNVTTRNGQGYTSYGHYIYFVENYQIGQYDMTTNILNYPLSNSVTISGGSRVCITISNDGNYLFIVGGGAADGNNKNNAFQIYDIVNNHMITGPNMHLIRSSLTCQVLNNYLYAFGGDAPGQPPRDQVERINIVDVGNIQSKSWQYIDTMTEGKNILRSVILNHNIYIVTGTNGTDLNTVEVIYGNNDSIVFVDEALPVRIRAGCAVTVTPKIYYLGGIDSNDSSVDTIFWTEPFSLNPTANPTIDPTIDPTVDPTSDPTTDPTANPTIDPTIHPTVDPTTNPTIDPTTDPTIDPTVDPTTDPTIDPTTDPTTDPTIDPTTDPTPDPTIDPTKDPTIIPTKNPTIDTKAPTSEPTSSEPGSLPLSPTLQPTTADGLEDGPTAENIAVDITSTESKQDENIIYVDGETDNNMVTMVLIFSAVVVVLILIIIGMAVWIKKSKNKSSNNTDAIEMEMETHSNITGMDIRKVGSVSSGASDNEYVYNDGLFTNNGSQSVGMKISNPQIVDNAFLPPKVPPVVVTDYGDTEGISDKDMLKRENSDGEGRNDDDIVHDVNKTNDMIGNTTHSNGDFEIIDENVTMGQ